jgi:hypothetical protein
MCKHHTLEAQGREEIYLRAFLTAAEDGGSDHITPRWFYSGYSVSKMLDCSQKWSDFMKEDIVSL